MKRHLTFNISMALHLFVFKTGREIVAAQKSMVTFAMEGKLLGIRFGSLDARAPRGIELQSKIG